MTIWDLGALARAAGSDVCGGALPESVEAVGTDSRSLPPRSLFVALRGDRFDGHDFVAAAIQAGAKAVLVDRAGSEKLGALAVPKLVVGDTLAALGAMAAYARQEIGKPVAGVTGSNGKTTTKEMLAAILSERGPAHRTRGNLNNLIGLPLTVFAWPKEAWAAVLEMGMSEPGEISRLARIAAPDVGLITMVGPAHLLGLGSVEAVARAKGELFQVLPLGATAIVNADDPLIGKVAVPLLGHKNRLTFGRAKGCDIRLMRCEPLADSGLAIDLEVEGHELSTTVPLVGPHNGMNAAGAAAAAWALGLTREEIAAGLAKVSVPGGRLRVRQNGRAGIAIVDDTYNANPASMRAAFATLTSVAKAGRKLAVLGDMLELGPQAQELHRAVGAAAAAAGISHLFAVGEHARDLVRGAADAGSRARHYESMDALLADLDAEVKRGDWVLVKGSRGMKMEQVVSHLEEKAE